MPDRLRDISIFEDEYFELNPVDALLCDEVEVADFLQESNVWKQLQLKLSCIIFELRNVLEDRDSPPEDLQFQRGRIFCAREILNFLPALMEELKQERSSEETEPQTEEN